MPDFNSDPNPTSTDLQEWDRWHLWHAFTQMDDYEPLVIHSASGVWLEDIHGRKFLDGVSSLWCNVHGHRHPHLDKAIREQLDRVSHVTLLGSSNTTTVRLAKKLADLTPGNLQHVFFGSDGASAVEAALKMAFQYWQQRENPVKTKTNFMALEYAYHGDTIGSVSLGGVEQFHSLFRPLLFTPIRIASPYKFGKKCGAEEESWTEDYIQQIRPIFEKHHNDTAALIIEPLMQGAAGMIAHPKGMLSAIRALCDEFDVLLIADEVAVGFGRTGRLFACQHEDVVPDIMCLGKGLTGGYLPLSATIANTKIWNAFLGGPENTLFHGHTFGGNPLAAAVALANIDLFCREGFLESLRPKIERMAERLSGLCASGIVEDVRQVGMMAGVELKSDQPGLGKKICLMIREQNVLLRPLGNVVVIMPPLVTELEQIDMIFDALHQTLSCVE